MLRLDGGRATCLEAARTASGSMNSWDQPVSAMTRNGMRPVHPGEVLKEDFLKPLGLRANALAKALSVPAPRINDVALKRRGISADTAMRLARYFGGDARSWLNLQTTYDLRVAEIRSAKRIAREVAPAPSAKQPHSNR